MRRSILAAATALLVFPANAEPLPDACTVLREVDAARHLPSPGEYSLLSDTQNAHVAMSMCNVSETGDGSGVVSLMLRQQLTDDHLKPSAAQRDEIAKSTAEQLGTEIEAETVDLGEAASWTPAMGQLSVWYRGGRTWLILSAPEPDPRGSAEEITREIIERFP